MTPTINKERLHNTVEQLAHYTEKDKPWTRRAFSKQYQEARNWLITQFEETGCNTHIDESGNLIAQLNNSAKKTIVIGSHIDTVPNGGKYDGILGVLVGLEILRVLKEQNLTLNHNLEVIDFLSEEVSDFGLSCIGSRGMVRKLNTEMLAYENQQKMTLNDAIKRVGGDTQKILNTKSRSDIKAFLECHIEQGRVLEDSQLDIGVVTSIVGLSKLELVFKGQSNHAGTTPMHLRSDAMLTLSHFIVEMTKLANAVNQNKKAYLVATAGLINITPNAANVIAGEAKVILDIRSTSQQIKEDFVTQLLIVAEKIAQQHSTQLKSQRLLSNTLPAPCHEKISDVFKESCHHLNLSYQLMPSGAGHDCAFMSQIAPSAMIFIPSKNGLSHSPDEYSTPDEMANGCQVMLEALFTIDKDKAI